MKRGEVEPKVKNFIRGAYFVLVTATGFVWSQAPQQVAAPIVMAATVIVAIATFRCLSGPATAIDRKTVYAICGINLLSAVAVIVILLAPSPLVKTSVALASMVAIVLCLKRLFGARVRLASEN
jgi:hypothetical protein